MVITIQAAAGRLLLPALSHWYGLTARERQILHHLSTGEAPKHTARLLDLSTHTVNDHLQAIYRKTGAAGRDELTAPFHLSPTGRTGVRQYVTALRFGGRLSTPHSARYREPIS